MFLLKTISPNTIPNRKADWDYKLCIYHWLLLRLATLYKRSAISDTIILEGIQIIHSVRDHWFEQELQRFRIDTALHMEYQHFPHIIKHRYRRSHIFNWTETLEISYNNKKHRINRADYINFETQFNGQLKISNAKDIILRSVFVQKRRQESVSTVTPPTKQKGKSKIAIKDVLLDRQFTSASDTTKPEVTKYQGFEENNIF